MPPLYGCCVCSGTGGGDLLYALRIHTFVRTLPFYTPPATTPVAATRCACDVRRWKLPPPHCLPYAAAAVLPTCRHCLPSTLYPTFTVLLPPSTTCSLPADLTFLYLVVLFGAWTRDGWLAGCSGWTIWAFRDAGPSTLQPVMLQHAFSLLHTFCCSV
jgi:hypothetical protein